MAKILIIDDDDSFREVLLFHLKGAGLEAEGASNGRDGLRKFDPSAHSVVVTDLKMPELDGMKVLKRLSQESPGTVVIVITAFGTIEKAVEAMKAGAFDFIPKPCTRDHFIMTVRKALEHHRLERRVGELEHVVRTGSREILFQSKAMRKALDLIDKVAPETATVLITGESGTGKELFAQRLHRKSPRINKPFIPVNCGAIPKELMESELFGHARGAFTGAERRKKGKFELASGGTLFLDEVAEIPLALQAKLLRALQEGSIDVLGMEMPVSVDLRVVAATNRDLEEAVESGAFREDLFYRLNVFQVTVPPLRDRPEDITLLTEYFLRIHSPKRNLKLSGETLQAMMAHTWPGNVRELENACRRMAILAEGEEITPDLLPSFRRGAKEPRTVSNGLNIELPEEGLSLVDLEKNVITRALRMNGYNQTKTAKYLGVPRHVLLYRIEKYEIEMKTGPPKN